jgi:hypothetical protein
MKPPAAFYEFALDCQDPRETDLDLDQTVKLAVSNLSKAECAELAAFLSKTLAARYSDVQLRDLWRHTSSGFIILEGIRGFLGAVLKELRAKG